ncbi:tetratricopeptide repeat protein [Leptolyngbya sp. PCC 6406]|uniref:tetratricopeptide repeat protein n=1 Tax=Leptolyngbya sp. PCC 6406 TaxID=1173264 RepID=UPI000684A6B4|nr:tetratricopeptide repeat protein [Leptolyngbya sp. PCC 6406]
MSDETPTPEQPSQTTQHIQARDSAQVTFVNTVNAETVNFGGAGQKLLPNIEPRPPLGQLDRLQQEHLWIDRAQVQAFLQQRLSPRPVPLVELVGAGGCGKTLGATWLYEQVGAAGFAQGIWLNLNLKPSFQEVGRHLYQEIKSLALEEQTDDQLLQRYLIAALMQRPYLVVLDQVEAVMATEGWPTLRGFLAAWQQQGYGSMVLLTSREPVLPAGTHRLDLGGFTESEGVAYLERRRVGATGTTSLEEIVRLTQGNPKVLQLVAAELRSAVDGVQGEEPPPQGPVLARVVDLLGQHLGSPEAQVGAVFGVLLGRLEPGQREVLLRVGVYRRRVTLAMAQAMVATTTAADLAVLVEQGFLEAQGERWTLHSLVAAEVGRALVAAGWVADSHQRAVAYFVSRLSQATIDLDDFLDGFHHHCELEEYSAAFDLVDRGYTALNRQGRYLILVDLYSRLGAAWQTQPPSDPQKRGQFAESLNRLGITYRSLGEYGRAIELHGQSLAIKEEIGDRNGQANVLNNLGGAYHSLGEYGRAIDLYGQSLAISEEIGDRNGQANSLNNLGTSYSSLGDYGRAIDLYGQSLAIFEEIGDRNGQANALGSLGNAYSSLGDYGRAIDLYGQSLAIFEEIGDRNGQASTLTNLGSTYLSLGDYRRAIDLYDQSLAIKMEIGDRKGQASTLTNLGLAYFSLGEYGRAIDLYGQSLPIFEEIGDRNGQANALMNLGSAYDSLGKYGRAIDLHGQSLAIFEEIGDRNGQASTLTNLGSTYLSLGDYRRAIDLYDQSLAIKMEIGDRKGQASTLTNLGLAYFSLGEYGRAIDLYGQSLAIKVEIGDRHGQADTLFNQAIVLAKLDDHWGAQREFEQARALYQGLGLAHRVEKCDRMIRERGRIIARERRQAPVIGPDPTAPPRPRARVAPAPPRPAVAPIQRRWLLLGQGVFLVLVGVLVVAILL